MRGKDFRILSRLAGDETAHFPFTGIRNAPSRKSAKRGPERNVCLVQNENENGSDLLRDRVPQQLEEFESKRLLKEFVPPRALEGPVPRVAFGAHFLNLLSFRQAFALHACLTAGDGPFHGNHVTFAADSCLQE